MDKSIHGTHRTLVHYLSAEVFLTEADELRIDSLVINQHSLFLT